MSGLLEIDKLCVWYGPVFALKDATLSVGSGEAVALIGANGAGKSTLFKSIVGFLHPKSGALRFLDRDVTGLRTEQRIRLGLGYSPEGRRVFPGLTVRENLEVAIFAGKAERARRVDRAFSLFPQLATRQEALGPVRRDDEECLVEGNGLVHGGLAQWSRQDRAPHLARRRTGKTRARDLPERAGATATQR